MTSPPHHYDEIQSRMLTFMALYERIIKTVETEISEIKSTQSNISSQVDSLKLEDITKLNGIETKFLLLENELTSIKKEIKENKRITCLKMALVGVVSLVVGYSGKGHVVDLITKVFSVL